MEDKIKITVANNLIELRKSRGWTQADVAKALNYSDKSVSKWEHADSLPDISILCALADMYGVTVDYLTHEDAGEKLRYLKAKSQNDASNRAVIVSMSVAVVYLIATIIFVYSIWNGALFWQSFIWGVPASSIVLLLIHRSWGGKKIYKTLLLSILCWSLLLSIYLQFLNYSLWLVFIVGIPIETIIVLGSKIQRRR
ncbi:MAG TPA: helix-turn-helix transcriptional regulator [Clostridia bacterium]|nr:helix-turn-helix transcriptional regulator [Clostridia bacterium]